MKNEVLEYMTADMETDDFYNAESIQAALKECTAVKKVICVKECDSTNNLAKRCAENGDKDGTLYVAQCQTGGRGRRGRQWISPKDGGIWMTLLLRPDINPASASMLTIVAAMAAASAIKNILKEESVNAECNIKWPNDVVINKKKICGILTEMRAEYEKIQYVIIGIGINVNMTEFPEEIKEIASSIRMQTGKRVSGSRIISAFAEEFTHYYQEFLKSMDLSNIKAEYNEILINTGKMVKICSSEEEYTGTAAGINSRGELLVVKEDGTNIKVSAGEVSVRGLYGYV